MFFRRLLSEVGNFTSARPSAGSSSTTSSSVRAPTADEFLQLNAFIKDNDLDHLKLLIESKGLDVNVPHTGLTLLHKAVAAHILQLQLRLQQQRRVRQVVVPTTTTSATAVSSSGAYSEEGKYGADVDEAAIIRYLVKERGADVHATTNDGTTPFGTAVFDGIVPVVRFFIEECDFSVDTISAQGYSSAFLSSHDDTIEALNYLIENGCSVDAPPPRSNTYLSNVQANSHHSHRPVVGSSINHTPFYGAALSGSVAAAQMLLDAGCDLELANEVLKALPATDRHVDVIALLKAESL